MPEREIDVLSLEGLALNGFIKEVKLVKCSGPTDKIVKGRVIAIDVNGRKYTTKCVEYGRASRVFLVLRRYIGGGKDMVSEKMMSGITYDLEEE